MLKMTGPKLRVVQTHAGTVSDMTIARMIDAEVHSVYWWRRKLGLPAYRRPGGREAPAPAYRWPIADVARLRELADRGLSSREIGLAMGRSKGSIMGAVYRHGIRLGGQG